MIKKQLFLLTFVLHVNYCLMKYVLLLLLAGAFSCTREPRKTGNVTAYVPVYMSEALAHNISVTPASAAKNPGKIYAYNAYLFQVEQGKGIHVIDNSVPQQANKIAFINVPGCSEIAIKSNYLYTNNVNDLVVISLANMAAPSVVSRHQNAFPQIDQKYPPLNNVYFECPDPSKGVVIGWEQKTIENPKCRR